VLPVLGDLGGVATFSSRTTTGTFSGNPDRYSLSLRQSELASITTGVVLVGVELSGTGVSLPTWAGLNPIAVSSQGNQAYALFAVEKAGLNALETRGNGAYSLQVGVAGDLNQDGNVNGVDSGLLQASLGSRLGDAAYNRGYDLNRDGSINSIDAQILNSNLGFVANQAPVVTPQTVKTHVDLQTRIALDKLATDPEGDPLFYRLINPVNGSLSFSPDGTFAQFLPTVGYSGAASFQVIADDGFGSSAPVTVTVNVSNAALTNLEFVSRTPKLQKGDTVELQVQGDFADQEDVLLPWSYLTFRSETQTVARVDMGQVTGLNNGISILTAERNGIQAVTVARVGNIPTPTNQQELYITIAEEQGLKLYPEAVTLIEGGQRQLLVSINDLPTSPDLRSAASGTRYFVSNSNILRVSETGLITALDEGVANVTVINAGTLTTVPVQVSLPSLNSAILGMKGGAVQAVDGALVTIAPGALFTDTTVSISQIAQANLPLTLPESFGFAGAFQLNLGNDPLLVPTQIAVPAPAGLAAGTEVLFMYVDQVPDAAGVFKPTWVVEESGIVGADGFIRTQSPPWRGVTRTDTYTIAVPKFRYKIVEATLPTEFLSFYDGVASVFGSIGEAVVKVISAPVLRITAGAAEIVRAAQDRVNKTETVVIPVFGDPVLDQFATRTAIEFSKDLVVVPVVGLPYTTSFGVSLNLNQLSPQGNPIARFTGFTPPATSVRISPAIESATVEFDEQGVLVRVKGTNFSSLPIPYQRPGEIDNLFVDWQYGAQVFRQPVTNRSATEFMIRPAPILPLSKELALQVVREVGVSGNYGAVKSSVGVLAFQSPVDRIWGTAPLSNSIKVINSRGATTVVTENGSDNLLLASIPLGNETEPRGIAALEDRVYVTLASDKSVALIDAVGL
jgi:hypothetical protein